LFRDPLHPYTRGLIGSIPVVGDVKDELAVIPGNVPNLIDLPKGCRFAPRCAPRVTEDVRLAGEVHPALLPVGPGHQVRCWLYHDAARKLMPRAAEALAGGRSVAEATGAAIAAAPGGGAAIGDEATAAGTRSMPQ
jgi:oligopeptide/dipeptide ABC transporter ATP-binding protein